MKVIIIGGGPAGMLAAITSAQNGNETTIIEKNNRLGKKLLITGKGRCNITSSIDINDFINLVSKMLPKECRRAIDVGGTYAKLCFNYDVIMRDTTLLYLAYLARDSKRVDMVAEWISDKAFIYGLTSERINIYTLGQVLEIIKTAESRI